MAVQGEFEGTPDVGCIDYTKNVGLQTSCNISEKLDIAHTRQKDFPSSWPNVIRGKIKKQTPNEVKSIKVKNNKNVKTVNTTQTEKSKQRYEVGSKNNASSGTSLPLWSYNVESPRLEGRFRAFEARFEFRVELFSQSH